MQSINKPSKDSIVHLASAYKQDIFDGIGDSSRAPLKGRYATFDNVDDYISAPHLIGTETVVSVQGTVDISNITISAGRIDVADAGKIWDLTLGDGTHYTFAEGGESFAEGASVLWDMGGNDNHATVFMQTNSLFWHTDGILGEGSNLPNLKGYAETNSPFDDVIIPISDNFTPNPADYDGALYTGQVKFPIQVKEHCFTGAGVASRVEYAFPTELISNTFTLTIDVNLDEISNGNDDRLFSLVNEVLDERFLIKRESSDSPNDDCIQVQNQDEVIYSDQSITWSGTKRVHVQLFNTAPYFYIWIDSQLLTFSSSFTHLTITQIKTLVIGGWSTSFVQYLDGYINRFALSTGLLIISEMDVLLQPYKGNDLTSLKIYYPLTEGAGTTVYDQSGNGNHGTITNPDVDCWDYFQYEYSNNHRGYNLNVDGGKIPCSLTNPHKDVLGADLTEAFTLGGKYLHRDTEVKLNPYDSPEIYNLTGVDSSTSQSIEDYVTGVTFGDLGNKVNNIETE